MKHDPQPVHAGRLTEAMALIVAAGGSDARESGQVATSLVAANLCGHDSHGVGMIPRYVDSLLEGGLMVNRHPTVVVDAGALLTLDGELGYGQVVGTEAMALGIERARQHGVCVLGLRRAHHLCRIGQFAEQAVSAGLISLHFTNVIARSLVAPFGGSDARFGTNPVAVGIPIPGEPPFILDMATSAVAQGKVRVAYNRGQPIPAGWLIDDQGRPTTDPKFGMVPPLGALNAFGLHKGYGLALVCELLGGALTGGGTWHSEDSSRRRVWNGMLTILIDPQRLGTGEVFAAETTAFIDWLRASPPAPGVDRVRIAGEPERESRIRCQREGITIDAVSWDEICTAGQKLGLSRSTIEEAAHG